MKTIAYLGVYITAFLLGTPHLVVVSLVQKEDFTKLSHHQRKKCLRQEISLHHEYEDDLEPRTLAHNLAVKATAASVVYQD
uniref:AlNc14C323G10617 protein n=1 Tax=Albugo laibachii Nc14 TaxID=890382 RepID=F0WWK6_9STRA|nr:AlNc14C323G10617 [Albugo laibachii Nc14]|eukprot:CCA25829.1 AlNc14C323G10617 [Albugo laibachii Nc14]